MIPKYIIIHHTGGTDADPLADTSHHTFEIVNNWHKQLWNFKSELGYYIGYTYFIEKDGKETQGRSETERAAHTIGYNTNSIGICLAGNFDATNPTEEQLKQLSELVTDCMRRNGIPIENVLFHRDVAEKTCPGLNFTKRILYKELVKKMSKSELLKFIIKIITKKINI